jgi:hypothetical protein
MHRLKDCWEMETLFDIYIYINRRVLLMLVDKKVHLVGEALSNLSGEDIKEERKAVSKNDKDMHV